MGYRQSRRFRSGSQSGNMLASRCHRTASDPYVLAAVMMYSGIAFMVAAVILAAAEHIAMIVIGRCLQGIAISFASVACPIYNSGEHQGMTFTHHFAKGWQMRAMTLQ